MSKKISKSTNTMFLVVLLFSLFGISCVEEELEESGTLELALVQECFENPRAARDYRDPDRIGGCCGDDICDGDERRTCPRDCAPATYCGDGSCNGNETPSSCSRDCGTCGNNRCDASETASSCASDCDLPTRVRVDKIRHCRGKILCLSKRSYWEYNYWDLTGVSKKHQRKTYLAKLSDPPKSQVKHLVFVSAGQQNNFSWNGGFDNDQSSGLTGQHDDYKRNFSVKDKSEWVTIDRGIAHEAVEAMGWPIHETFAAEAFDARFHFEFSESTKVGTLIAYYAWLRSKFDSSKIESIYLAGHSRGGCLVARLGALFARDFGNRVPVIIHSFDGVCRQSSSAWGAQGIAEFGVGSVRIPNPLNSANRAFATDLTRQFSRRNTVAFLNQISGGRVAFGARAFSHYQATGATYSSGGSRPWLRQIWWNMDHFQIENANVRAVAIDHLRTQCAALGGC